MAALARRRGVGAETSLWLVRSLLAGDSISQSEGKLLELATGRFYTHEFIGRRLAKQVARIDATRQHDTLAIVDPFCGDGRLVEWYLEELGRSERAQSIDLSVDLWDCDPIAVRKAAVRIRGLTANVGSIRVRTRHWDTFERAQNRYGEFDVVLTNPPWELLKPDPRQLRGLTKSEARFHSESLRKEDARLSELYPAARPSVRYAGWGFNLSRSGMEVSLRLLAPHGILGLVMPASVLADNSSSRIRELLVRDYRLEALDYFPSESRLFPTADYPAVSLLIRKEPGSGVSADLTVFDAELRERASGHLKIALEELQQSDFMIPGQFSPETYSVLRQFRRFEEFGELEGTGASSLVAGRELDETRISERLSSTGAVRFVKGRMVHRFEVDFEPTQFLNPDVEVPESARHPRIAWRDVSRMSQARRIQACLLPPDVVTGNSLSVAYFRDDDTSRLKALLAVMSSIVFEFQVRTYLATSHISLASVRKGRIPSFDNDGFVEGMARICSRCLRGDARAHVEIEVRLAQAYGISKRAFEIIIGEFGRLSSEAKEELLSAEDWDCIPPWVDN